MPITPATTVPILLGALASNGNLGLGTPKVAQGLGQGYCQWISQIKVTSQAAGTLGVGIGVLPLFLPVPLLNTAFSISFVATKIYGPMSPSFIAGIAMGLSVSTMTGIVTVKHPTVGVGAGVLRFVAPPAEPVFKAAFESEGVPGGVQLSKAVGGALDAIFAALTFPVAIAGTPNIIPGAGPGDGKIL